MGMPPPPAPAPRLDDSSRILFVTAAGEVLIYDAQGKRVRAMTLPEGAEITPQSSGASSPTNGGNKQASALRDAKDNDDDSDDEAKGGEEKEASETSRGGKGRVIFVDWYDGAEGLMHPQVPTLCIALEGGFVQLSQGVDDDAPPLVVNAHMTIRQASFGSRFGWSLSSFRKPSEKSRHSRKQKASRLIIRAHFIHLNIPTTRPKH